MRRTLLAAFAACCLLAVAAYADDMTPYPVGHLKPTDSTLKVKVGDTAPDFTLPEINGGTVSLSDYRGKKNVVLSFVPAAWTPVCSDQWPGYNLALDMIHALDAELIGISVDNTPTQAQWAEAMHGLNFPVLSDFWPHGKVADSFGVLRGDGMAERAVIIIDKAGIIRYVDVHDINSRPDLGVMIGELEKLAE
ncbi:peroxiredoxin [Pseudodesulfovibrio thermohalotolerans]|uniref:peroxiredoxin n=1 Tax=Pseudodesulfovibrio thermohalotolerans TaxID=2880651 RepID=UPI0024429B56|nr:peroxiredoxin [Pseudodesulfovibrio thermohalotolerans]WFS63281.1 peroxiredoxin [Pseudodesulfovibrio thermohalotolerans]